MNEPAGPIEEAAFWYACLRAEDATEQDRRRWQQWLDASPAHRQAWARIQALSGLFGKVPGRLASSVLTRKASRRAVLRSTALAVCAGLAGAEAWRHLSSLPELHAGLRTGTGEQRREVLADGSLLYLNTGTAVDVAFGRDARRVVLHAGEILVETRPDVAPGRARPFVVYTPHGSVRALGTRFVVRLYDGRTGVQVLQDAVEISPALSAAPAVRLAAGQEIMFDDRGAGLPQLLATGAGAWMDARLSVVDMRLQDFVAELARYRKGYLGCAPELARLPISGVFPLDDTDQALAMLENAFPVRVRRFTPYWARVVPVG